LATPYLASIPHDELVRIGRRGGLARVARLGRVAAAAPARAAWLATFDATAADADISRKLSPDARAAVVQAALREAMRSLSRKRWDRTGEPER
jgi:hypothetical protein